MGRHDLVALATKKDLAGKSLELLLSGERIKTELCVAAGFPLDFEHGGMDDQIIA